VICADGEYFYDDRSEYNEVFMNPSMIFKLLAGALIFFTGTPALVVAGALRLELKNNDVWVMAGDSHTLIAKLQSPLNQDWRAASKANDPEKLAAAQTAIDEVEAQIQAAVQPVPLRFEIEKDDSGDAQPIAIIPQPVKLERGPGTFEITPETLVVADERCSNTARQLIQWLKPAMGFELELSNQAASAKPTITLVEDPKSNSPGAEGYRLIVGPERIQISAGSQAGLFYGLQTLRQLLPPGIFSSAPLKDTKWEIPCVKIEDAPRFKWRGFMMDSGHCFQSVDYIKKVIDIMSVYKLNVFHWHLTDDCTWALEIKGRPDLIDPKFRAEKVQSTGFYTQDQIREVVKYAADRHVTIVPEIDVPGHSSIALRAFPELKCPVPDGLGPDGTPQSRRSFCVGNEKTYEFLEAVFSQVADLFPGEYVHIGADEVSKKYWQDCPRCQAGIEENHLKDVQELQSYFAKRMEKFLQSKGRRMIGWEEVAQGGLSPTTTLMSWTDMKHGLLAAKNGNDVIMAPRTFVYFDRKVTICRVYSFNPAPPSLSPAEAGHILGGEAAMWGGLSGALPEKHINAAIFPRLLPLAEALWSPQDIRHYDRFLPRLEAHIPRLNFFDVNCGRVEKGRELAFWELKGAKISEVPEVVDWPVRGGLNEPGNYTIQFIHEIGGALQILKAELIQDGGVIGSDTRALDAIKNNLNPCRIPVSKTPSSSPVILRATVLMQKNGRNYSSGTILIDKR